MKKYLIPVFVALFAFSCDGTEQKGEVGATPETPAEALELLLDGNKRYMSESNAHPNLGMQRLGQTAPHQEPFAAVVGCSDSRVPVELLFDRGVGDIFVIRTAGNNVGGDMVMGSVEYAVGHLGVQVLLVLGHESCGGVTSAVTGGEHAGSVGNLIHCIQQDIPEYVGVADQIDEAIAKHTAVQVEEILSNSLVAQKAKEGKLLVKGAHYDVNSGEVKIY